MNYIEAVEEILAEKKLEYVAIGMKENVLTVVFRKEWAPELDNTIRETHSIAVTGNTNVDRVAAFKVELNQMFSHFRINEGTD